MPFSTRTNLFALILFITFINTACVSTGNGRIFTHGPIVTMDKDNPHAEAVWVQGGEIKFVGKEQKALALAGNKVDIVDLKGQALLPGLVEAHTHPIATAMLGQTIDVSGFSHNSRAEVMATLAEEGGGKPYLKWTVAFGWDPVMVADLEPPTLAELDAISPNKPFVILTQMMHDAYANSAALAAAGIDDKTSNPPGGEFVRDETGKLTGTVREVSAINKLMAAIPTPPKGSVDLLTALQFSKYAREGVTTLGVLGPVGKVEQPIKMLKNLAENNNQVRVVVYGLPDQLDGGSWEVDQDGDRFRLRGVKFWMDGSPFAGGAAWEAPYENTPLVRERLHLGHNHMAALNHDLESFEANFAKYHQRGFQIAVHVQGERAVDRVLDVAERVLAKYPRNDHRHRLEHNALISSSQLGRAQTLGFTPSFFVDHIYYYGDKLTDLVGEERTRRYMPVKEAYSAGHIPSLHTDNPATPIGPLRAASTAVLRKAKKGSYTFEDQAITKEQALRAITINAAWQLGMENEIGSIEEGKRADFVILNKNPLAIPAEQYKNIKVVSTWVDGEQVNLSPYTWRNVRLALGVLGNLF